MLNLMATAPIPTETALGEWLATLMTNSGGATHVIAWLFYALFLLIAIDIVTGWMKGFYNGNLDSAKNHRGYIRKIVLMTMAVMAIALDFIVSTLLFYMGMADFTVLGFYVVEVPVLSGVLLVWFMLGEILSILENVAAMGINMPKFIQAGLNRLHSNLDEGNIDIKSRVRKDEEGNTVIENSMVVPPKTGDTSEVSKKMSVPQEERKEDENGSSKE